MNSLRIRLVAWYVSIAAVVVLFIALLASAIVFELLSFEAQQSLATAVRHAPAILNTYEQEHPSSDNIETYLREQLASYDVYARVRHNGTSTHQESNTRPPGIAGFGPPPPFFVRLFALQIRPVLVHYRAGDALLSVDPSRLLRTMGYLWLIVAVFAAVLIGIAWRVAIVVATQTLEPLVRTTRALNRFGDGDFAPEEVRTTDRSEVGALATAFNRAVEQITRAFAERSRTEAEMRQFVADAGHQLRTPLTVVVGHLSAMEAKAESPRQVTVYRSMLAQSRRMRALIDDLITLARLEHGSARSAGTVDINDLCARIPNAFED
ncbi:MAG TPA: HAMP domain-containing sensor histidine kinase, partial [Candidatus Baltobacteraceae bacterium]